MSTADCPQRTVHEVTVSTTLPAPAPPVRFAALRGRVPLRWGAVAALAVVLAFANGFVIVALAGGAIERAQHPFTDWLSYSAILVPVFVLAVMWALARARRRGHRAAKTVLLVAAAAAAVGIAALIANTTYDYHLQTQLLAKVSGLHVHGSAPGDTGNSALRRQCVEPRTARDPAGGREGGRPRRRRPGRRQRLLRRLGHRPARRPPAGAPERAAGIGPNAAMSGALARSHPAGGRVSSGAARDPGVRAESGRHEVTVAAPTPCRPVR